MRSALTPSRNAAEPPTNAHNIGINATRIGNGRSAANRNPAVRIVVGHGTPNVGACGNT
jgi:hypothetical protein